MMMNVAILGFLAIHGNQGKLGEMILLSGNQKTKNEGKSKILKQTKTKQNIETWGIWLIQDHLCAL